MRFHRGARGLGIEVCRLLARSGCGRARPATSALGAFIDEHRDRFGGVAPICRVLTQHGCKIPVTYSVAVSARAGRALRLVLVHQVVKRCQSPAYPRISAGMPSSTAARASGESPLVRLAGTGAFGSVSAVEGGVSTGPRVAPRGVILAPGKATCREPAPHRAPGRPAASTPTGAALLDFSDACRGLASAGKGALACLCSRPADRAVPGRAVAGPNPSSVRPESNIAGWPISGSDDERGMRR